MAVSFDGTRITDADEEEPTSPVAGIWEDVGGGAAVVENNFFYQGSYSIAEQVKTSESGTCFVPDTDTYDATDGYVFVLKGLVSTSGLLANTRATGQKFEIGSGASSGSGRPSNYYQWYTYYLDTYPAIGGWIIHAFDVREEGLVDNEAGTVSNSAINYWGHVATMTSTAVKAPNVAMDAIDYVYVGDGFTWTGSDGYFQEFVNFDEGTSGNRYGIVTTKAGVLYVLAVLTIGSATATTFTDSNQKLIFPWTYVGEGALGVDIDLQNASTSVDFTVCSFTGNGQSSVKKFFDTNLEVDAGNDDITVVGHGWVTGDYVEYSNEGGSHTLGLTDGNSYWVYVIDDDTVAIHGSRTSAFGDTTRVNLSAGASPGENHSLTRNPDNRIDISVSGTSGELNFASCIIEGVRTLVLTSACDITSGFIQNIGNVTASTATITGAIVSDATLEEGVALFTPLSTLSNITECSFASDGYGHAFELTSTGSTDSNANTYTDYWVPTISGDAYGWEFHTIDGVDASTDIITTDAAHGFSTGDAVYYNDESGTDDINLDDGYKYYVNVTGTTTFSVHATRAAAVAGSSKIDLSDGSSGETHAMYSSNATLYNNSGGHVTINVLNDGDSPSVRNGAGASTTVVNTKTLTVTCLNTAGNGIENVRVRIEASSDGSLISEGYTNASGVYQDTSYSFTVEVSVKVKARLKGFRFNEASDTITASGLSVPFTMIKDAAVDLP